MLYKKRAQYNNMIKNFQFNGTHFIFDYNCFYIIIGVVQSICLLMNYEKYNQLLIKIFKMDIFIVFVAIIILFILRKKIRKKQIESY